MTFNLLRRHVTRLTFRVQRHSIYYSLLIIWLHKYGRMAYSNLTYWMCHNNNITIAITYVITDTSWHTHNLHPTHNTHHHTTPHNTQHHPTHTYNTPEYMRFTIVAQSFIYTFSLIWLISHLFYYYCSCYKKHQQAITLT